MSDYPLSIFGDSQEREIFDDSQEREKTPLEALERLGSTKDLAGWPPGDRLDDLLARVRRRVALVMARCAAVDVFVAAQLDFSSTTDDVEAVYADLQLFCRWHKSSQEETESREDRLRHRLAVCEGLVESEALLANQVNQWLLFLQSQQTRDSALRLFLSQVAAWHAHVRRQLEHIAFAVERQLEDSRQDAPPADDDESGRSVRAGLGDSNQELRERADEMVGAQSLDLLAAFTGLAHVDRRRLVEFLADAACYPRRRQLFESLWSVSDLILIEDPLARDRHSLLGELRRDEAHGERFRRLARLLEEPEPDVSAEGLDAALGATLEENERAMLWRALLVAHPNAAVRRRAAATVPLDALWQVLVYPHSPLTAMRLIAGEVAVRGGEDLRKVFFDCIKSRLMNALGEVENAGQLEVLGGFIGLFFGFGFFIQTRYFEQLETLLHLFQAQASRFGVPATRFGRDLHRLEIQRHQAGSPDATNPRSLDRLPLPVQRHLAREGCYLDFFACHPNHLIAREVLHFLHVDNLSRYLRLPDLNRQMLEEAMRRLDLGPRRGLVLDVLTHPKCPVLFAGKHLPRLGRRDLHRVVQSRSTHSEVKRKAMLIMIRMRGSEQTEVGL